MYYFASDIHLGLDGATSSVQREKLLISWLDDVAADADAIYLMGDVFDFWFEYKRVIPRGFTRLLGKLSQLTDKGVKIHLFTGNHDMWAYDYLHQECGVELHHAPEVVTLGSKRVFLAHGDNMYVRKTRMVKFMNWCFHNNFLRWLFPRLVHPDLAMRFGLWWSQKSRHAKNISHSFGGEQEPLIEYVRDWSRSNSADYFIFGHIHCAEDFDLGNGCRAIFLGEWIQNPTYAVMNNQGEIKLKKYEI